MKRMFQILSIIIVLILFDISLSLSPIFFNFSQHKKQIKSHIITAHRGGYEKLFPENSMAAINNTLSKKKANRIEVDIHQTKDNCLVVMHDKTINRTTNGKGLIKHFTYQELQKFTLNGSVNNEKIPLLEDVLKAINGKTKLVIELKYGNTFYPKIEERTIELIKKYNAENSCIIHSFDDDILNKIHQLDANIPLHKLFILKLRFLPIIYDIKLRIKSLKDYNFIDEFSVMYIFANKEIIRQSKTLNKHINVWTVDENETKQKLLDLGVDGIITNYP